MLAFSFFMTHIEDYVNFSWRNRIFYWKHANEILLGEIWIFIFTETNIFHHTTRKFKLCKNNNMNDSYKFFQFTKFSFVFFFLFSSSSNCFYNISQFQSHFIRNLFLWDKISKFLWWNITSHPNWAWWGLRVRDFRFRFGMRSTPKLLFRFLFFLSLGRSIGFPCASTGYGERAWCKISQHRFLSRPLGLQTKTMPATSRVHPAHIKLGDELQLGIMQLCCHPIFTPPFPSALW